MDWLNSIASDIRNYFTPQRSGQDLISPMQTATGGSDLSNPALLNYYRNEDPGFPQQQPPSANYGTPTPTPTKQLQQTLRQPSAMVSPTVTQYGGTNSPSPTRIPGVNPQVSQQFLDLLHNHILPVTRKYGIPDAVVGAQMAQESGYAQKPAGNNNFFGLKAHSYPGFAHFDTPEQGAEYYAQTVSHLVPNVSKMNAMQVLQGLQSGRQHYEADNPDPMQYVYDVSNNPVWSSFGEQPMKNNPNGWAK